MTRTSHDLVRSGLTADLNGEVIDELLAAYEEIKANTYLGGLRLAAVEAGRFCEAVVRVLEEESTGSHTALDSRLDVDKRLRTLENDTSLDDSLRLHIPRAVRVISGVRNSRNNAHLRRGIEPNTQDCALVNANADWVLAELVRLHHNVPPDDAGRLIEDLVTRRAPAVQDFDGFLKVLNPTLSAGDHLLLLLHQRGTLGATLSELRAWSRRDMLANLTRTLKRLVEHMAWVHNDGERYFITQSGLESIESRRLVMLPKRS